MNSNDSHNPAGFTPHASAGAAPAPAPVKPAAELGATPPSRAPEASSIRRIKLGLTRLVIVFAVVFTARYVYWRSTQTMNPAARWFFYAFLIAEVLNILEALLFYVTTWAPTRYRTPEAVQGRTVDVFITTYNEPVEMLRETVLCSVGIRYPHKTLILDDGDRPEVKQLADGFKCGYIARRDRTNAKAGNLN